MRPFTRKDKPVRRTGAAAAGTMDRIGITNVAVVLLSLGVAGAAIGSIEGLLHAGGWAEPDQLVWTLPLSVDVFLIGTMLAHLQLRERRAYVSAVFVLCATIALVSFSATMNFLYVRSANPVGSMEYEVGAYIKGSMPVLLLVALEIIAALKSTRNNRASSPLNKTKVKLKDSQAKVRALQALVKTETKQARRTRRIDKDPASGDPIGDLQAVAMEAHTYPASGAVWSPPAPLPHASGVVLTSIPPSPVQVPLDMGERR